jgi:hypothetical protein
MLAPQRGVDIAVAIERRDEFITMLLRPLGKLFRAGEIEPDTLEAGWQNGHRNISSVGKV